LTDPAAPTGSSVQHDAEKAGGFVARCREGSMLEDDCDRFAQRSGGVEVAANDGARRRHRTDRDSFDAVLVEDAGHAGDITAPRRTLGSGLALGTRGTGLSPCPLWARRSRGPARSLRSCFAPRAAGSARALRATVASWALRSRHARGSERARHADGSGFALWPLGSGRPRGPLRTAGALGALLPIVAALAWLSCFTVRSLRP
jgi:hypothetical protein